jgi:hypothetical protein
MPNTPAYILYHGRNTGKDKQGKKIWTRIGAVWPNKNGKGFNLTWDYVPLGDGLTVMLPYDKESIGVWRILCMAQIEHKRISKYAMVANRTHM